ncbi:MAG: DUF3991 and toprim domain-containing protein [Intestinimonas sp.]|nr:DUF3991 and toprim domain-containing protein [Intestinimonas sp.]
MSGYVHFTDEEKKRANSVDLVDFLQRQGERLLPSGRDKRLTSDHSITIRGNQWFDHSSEEGSHAIDLVRRLYNLSFPQAVTLLLGGEQRIEYQQSDRSKEPEPKKPFELPPANPDMRRVFAYLIKQRFIDRDVVTCFAKAKMLYEDKKYHNAVFVGCDADGIPRHAHKHGTYSGGKSYKGNVEGCDPQFSFHYTGTGNSVYVFEAPIDLLSFLTLYPQDWKRQSYVSLCGVAEHALLEQLQEHPNIREVFLCLDHDEAGIKATERLEKILQGHGYSDVSVLQSQYKDWNEDLKTRHGVEPLAAEEPDFEEQHCGMKMTL